MSKWRKSGELFTGYNSRGYYLCTTNGEISAAMEHFRDMGISILSMAAGAKKDRETIPAEL